MKRKNSKHKQNISQALQPHLKLSGLQARMTFSYVWVTVACVLLLEIMVMIIVFLIVIVLSAPASDLIPAAERTTQNDADKITSQLMTTKPASLTLGDPQSNSLDGNTLKLTLGDPQSNSLDGNTLKANNLDIPYVKQRYPDDSRIAFALLITPDERIAVSSYPARFGVKKPAPPLLPYATTMINKALAGVISKKSTPYTTATGMNVISNAIPIWNKQRIVGALYVEIPNAPIVLPNVTDFLEPVGVTLLVSSVIALFFTAPIGGIFGMITTRSLVSRLRRLVSATTLVADGSYEQRVSVTRKDEVGQLEQQFNRMAEQLHESMMQRQNLAEQNARLSERSRISRELHDAISQDLFSLSMLAGGLQVALPPDSPLQTQLTTLSSTATNTIREMRALLLELRPLQLEDLGLAEGLQELATSYSTRLGIIVHTEISAVEVSIKAAHTLLRISQEALTNAVRHANATEITLSLVPFENYVTLRIRDNGSGFSPDESRVQHGLGLHLMQERVQELNGTFTLQSTPGQGTSIHVCLAQEHPSDSSFDC